MWPVCVYPELGKERQEDEELKASLDCRRACLRKQNKMEKRPPEKLKAFLL